MGKQKTYSLGTISSTRDELFGFAILSIMLLHFFQDVNQLGGPVWLRGVAHWYGIGMGALGVDVFLFLSGMGLYYSMSRDPSVSHFYKKRLARIVPTYLVVGMVFWAIRLWIKGGTFTDWWQNLLFVTYFTKGTLTLWFIFFILVMYLVYPLIHKYLNSTEKDSIRTLRFVLLVAVVIAVSLTLFHWFHQTPIAKDIVYGRIPVFLLGCYLGKYIKEGMSFYRPAFLSGAAILYGIGFVLRYYDTTYLVRRYIDILPTLGLIILFSALVEVQKNVDNKGRLFLRAAGSYSLELYLTHVCCRNLAKAWDIPTNKLWVYLCVIAVSVILSIPLHRMGNWFGQLAKGKKTVPMERA